MELFQVQLLIKLCQSEGYIVHRNRSLDPFRWLFPITKIIYFNLNILRSFILK
jgi:hypothetical protein